MKKDCIPANKPGDAVQGANREEWLHNRYEDRNGESQPGTVAVNQLNTATSGGIAAGVAAVPGICIPACREGW